MFIFPGFCERPAKHIHFSNYSVGKNMCLDVQHKYVGDASKTLAFT